MARKKYVKENNLVKAINTDSLELQKPLVNEYYDINVHNSNMDKIDLGYKQNKNDISNINYELSKTENTKYSTENGIKEFSCKNGYVDNVVIEGKTLVNLADKYSVRTDSGDGISRLYFTQQKRCTNGTYTCFNFADKTIAFNQRTLANDVYVGQTHVSANSCKVVEVNAENVIYGIDFQPEFGWSNEDTSIYTSSMFAVLEGDHTDKPISYFEGLKSVGQGDKIEVLSYKTNEDISSDINVNWIDGYYIECGLNSNYGNLLPFDGVSYHQEYIPVEPNTRYILYNVNSNVSIYDNAKSMINLQAQSQIAWVSTLSYLNGITFIDTKENIKFIRLTALTNKKADIKIYKNSNYDKKQILTTLRSLPNGVKDTIEKRGNKYYKIKRCYEGTLLKSQLTLNTGKNGYSFIMSDFGMPNIKPKNIYNVAEGRIVCNKLKEGKEYGYTIENGGIYHNQKDASSNQMITIATKGTENINEFTIVYELETPIIEELPNFNPQTFSDKTTLLLNTGVVQGEANFEVTNSLGSELEVLKNKVSNLDDSVVDEEVYYPTLLNGFQAPFVDDNVSIVRVDKICILNISAFNQSGYSVGTLLCKMNDRFKPRGTIRTYGFDLLNNKIVHLDINNEGVKIQNNVTSSANVRINVVWEVE